VTWDELTALKNKILQTTCFELAIHKIMILKLADRDVGNGT
jgi:hypothetical protein